MNSLFTSVLDQKKVYFEIHTQQYTFLEMSRCEDLENDNGEIRSDASLVWKFSWHFVPISGTQKIMNSLFQPITSIMGVQKWFLVGKMAIKGGEVILIKFFSKILRFAIKRTFFLFRKAFLIKKNLKPFFGIS